MKFLTPLLIAFFTIPVLGQTTTKNEIGVVVSPLEFSKQESYGIRYLRTINKQLDLRAGLRFYANTSQEVRSDTLSSSFGTIQYDLRLGIQRDLQLGSFDAVKPYFASDFSFNSEFRKESYESYYGYYWNMSVNPILGLESEPLPRLRVYFEVGSDLNINLQEYSAVGENYDRKFVYNPVGYLALGVGYKF